MDDKAEMDAIGRILASEEALVPSSGFVSAVMERVREESAAPAPIPFPWKRATPGIVLAAGVFGWGGLEMLRQASAMTISLAPLHVSAAATSGLESGGWVVLAIAVSMAAWRLSHRLIGRAGLL
jgi:hypothetical protein